ncbi:MAG: alpha-glucosidase [Bacteroidota bacterium]
MKKTWWKEGVMYQIYPRSFNDSNGDGVGDLRGIIEKLDYLKDLGVDILWLSPIYQSPNDDNGYDISDYYDIMTEFGTMADFDEMIAGIHERGMRLVMDLVVNHTSDEHEWFKQSSSSKDNPYRDYYIWRPPVDGQPPSNWNAFFGGKAWEWDKQTGEYYLHLFSKKQPDLNWENETVRAEVYKMMRFWLDKGVDGFRMDVIPFISKRLDWPAADLSNFGKTILEIYANGPRLHEFLNEMNREVTSKYDVMTVGEAPGVTPELANLYVGEDRDELNMIFHFAHMFIGQGEGGKFDPVPWKLSDFKQGFIDWDRGVADKGWVNIYLDNHDFARMVSRFGNDSPEFRKYAAKMLSMLILSMRGTPCIYQGSEIGMTNVAFDSIDDYRDIESLNLYAEHVERGGDGAQFLKAIHEVGRDNVRTPVQWSNTEHGGFTSGTPWIKVNPNYPEINVEEAQQDPDSILAFYQDMIKFRKANSTMVYGKFQPMDIEDQATFTYKRKDEDGEFWVVLNFSDDPQPFELPEVREMELTVSNYHGVGVNSRTLNPWEGRIFKVLTK